MIDDVLADAKDRMGKAVEALRKELATIRTGRAHPGLIEHLRVDYYGAPTPLNQLATINVPEPRLLTILSRSVGSGRAILSSTHPLSSRTFKISSFIVKGISCVLLT